ncbi:MAG: hypothetical protein HOZ81_26780 [Streptomyces sp.]|nr:hypothetical protein [Streptomyces sp.]
MSTAPGHETDEEIDDTIKVRANRQARLKGANPLGVLLVLNEAVVRRPVGAHV